MHPLIPDDITFRSHATGAVLETRTLHEVAGNRTPAIGSRLSMSDLFYSFGVTHPGAIRLHNYPRHLQDLRRDNGERFDLAAVDILRDRERGVPRYNQFRRLLHKDPVRSFEELTDNPDWQRELRDVYQNDLEKVDLMAGSVRRAAAGRLRVQRDGVPRVRAHGVAPAQERSVLHR